MSTPTADATPQPDLTTLLHAWRNGSGGAFSALIDQVYGELNIIAAKRLSQMGSNNSNTLSPADLLHEAIIDIIPTDMAFNNRAHFFATISLAIRSTLVDRARARAAVKRGGDMLRVTLTSVDSGESSMALDLLSIDEALMQLEKLDPRCGQVMHLTYFAGLAREEIAVMLNVNVRTVARDLLFGRAWIAKAMTGDA